MLALPLVALEMRRHPLSLAGAYLATLQTLSEILPFRSFIVICLGDARNIKRLRATDNGQFP
jgi:hypothetical protein